MTLYQIIYEFFATYFFTDSTLEAMEEQIGGQTISLNEWLCHSCTLIVLALFLIVLVLAVKWVFKAVSGALVRIGG